MNEEFKKKLKDYKDGKLPENEVNELERELEKLEIYQSVIEEDLQDSSQRTDREESDLHDEKRQGMILKRCKWKARIQNALTAIIILFALTVIFSILSNVFYFTGSPDRSETYRDVVESTIAITHPNIRARGGAEVNPFLSMKMEADLYKQVGSEALKTGDMLMNFLLGKAGYPEYEWLSGQYDSYAFLYPGTAKVEGDDDWDKLEILPEGSVVEAYLSFNRFFETDEILQKFKDRDMKPVWLAVDTGFDDYSDKNKLSAHYPVGFPYQPLWHHNDWTVKEQTEEKKWPLWKEIMRSAEAPSVEPYGSGEIRNKNFVDTLLLLDKYEDISNRIATGGKLNIKERLEFIDKHGVRIYGMVVTGPSKEILKLREEDWISKIQTGEARLWNWYNY